MTIAVDMALAASLVGDPARANILTALMDGRAHTATELALVAGIAPPTASGHLAKLMRGRLVDVVAQGRHRYYRLASADAARMLESIMSFASDPSGAAPGARRRATPRIDPALRRARTCYDHIAGELGVAIADRLAKSGVVELLPASVIVTDAGRRKLDKAGIVIDPSGAGRRPDCRPCLDWSERRTHLAGTLGLAILEHGLRLGVVRRSKTGRALDIAGDIPDVLRRFGLP
jgi:DNA-binding transcriptional ArsR family regulator